MRIRILLASMMALLAFSLVSCQTGKAPEDVILTLDPTAVTMAPETSTAFEAIVTGSSDTGVTWSVTCGVITGTGSTVTYTAPASEGSCTVTATSVADTSKSASATVTTEIAPMVVVTPADVTLAPNRTHEFTATVSGVDDTSVTWSTTGGTIIGSGTTVDYVAPNILDAYSLTATSVEAPTAHASATIRVAAHVDQIWAFQESTDAAEVVMDVAIDASDNVIIAGYTFGDLFARNQGNADAFVAKIAADGTPLWGIQHGTSTSDSAVAVAVDPTGNVFVVGTTHGSLFGPHQGASDAFIAVVAANGAMAGFQYGTSTSDYGNGVAADSVGNVYVAGATYGSLFAPNLGLDDAYIGKFAPNGVPIWALQYGTTGSDRAPALAVDAADAVVVAGTTNGDLFAPNYGSDDVFVAKALADGSPAWGYQYGSADSDEPLSIATDLAGNVLLVGQTFGNMFAPVNGLTDGFAVKIGSNGTPMWGYQYGSSGFDAVSCVAADSAGQVVLAGLTEGDLFGPSQGGADLFLASIEPDGTVLGGEQFGTTSNDLAYGLAFDGQDDLLLVGGTYGDFAGPNQGDEDAFVIKLAH